MVQLYATAPFGGGAGAENGGREYRVSAVYTSKGNTLCLTEWGIGNRLLVEIRNSGEI